MPASSFSSTAASASLPSSSPAASLPSAAANGPRAQRASTDAAPSSLSQRSSTGFYASLARLVAPLFSPFRRQLGLDTIAVARYLTDAAVTASLADPNAPKYHLTPHPVTSVSPLTTLHMFLLHSTLIQRIQRAALPGSPARASLERWQAVHRACLECWWSHIADATAPVVGGLMLNKTMMTTQTHILGLFQALDLCMAEPDGEQRRQLLWSVLYRNLYGEEGAEGGESRRLEVMRLAEWVQVEWAKLRVAEVGGDGADHGVKLNIARLLELREEDRAEAERVVHLVTYELKEGKLVVGAVPASS